MCCSAIFEAIEVKGQWRLNFEAVTSKFCNQFLKFFLFALLTRVSKKRQINQNFGTVCHTEVCLTFSRLTAKLSELITKFRGRNLKIQPRSSFDLNGIKNGTAKHFENSLKSMHLFQRLMGGINCREISPQNQMS